MQERLSNLVDLQQNPNIHIPRPLRPDPSGIQRNQGTS
jgi:hypothetical protein